MVVRCVLNVGEIVYKQNDYILHNMVYTGCFLNSFSIISTFRYQYFPSRRGGVSGFGIPPASSRRQPGNNNNRHDWGAGHQLGGH